MYGLEENEIPGNGKVISVWSPVHRQGAVSANTALIASYLANMVVDADEKVLVMSNETSINIQASKYLTSATLIDRLSGVCMMSKSGNLNTVADLMPYTENIGENLDVIGPTFKDNLLGSDIVDEIENILSVAKQAYKYTVIDTSSGIWNKSSKKIIDIADIIIVCLPQDKYTVIKYKEEDDAIFNPVLKTKNVIYVSALHYEYEHFGISMMRRMVGEKVIPISLNDAVNKALCNRSIFDFIRYETSKKKPDDIVYELDDIVNLITALTWDEQTEGIKGSEKIKWKSQEL